jgi:hypothetical protein
VESEEVQELLERAQFGKQIEQFWGSRIGAYLQARADELYSTALEQLKTVDPEDTKAIRKLQNEIFKAESFKTWLSDAVTDGLKSLELLTGDDE